MKLLTSAALAASLCITSVTPAIAENIVGSVKAWQYMQADGWKSADGYDDNRMHNELYQAVVLDNYPTFCFVAEAVVRFIWQTRKLKLSNTSI